MKRQRLVALAAVAAISLTSGAANAVTGTSGPSTRPTMAAIERALTPPAISAMRQLLRNTSAPLSAPAQAALRRQLTVSGVEKDLRLGIVRAREIANAHSLHLNEAALVRYNSLLASPSFSQQLGAYLSRIDKNYASQSYAHFLEALAGIPNPFSFAGAAVAALVGLAAGICIALEPCGAEATVLDVLILGGTTIAAELTLAGEKINQEQGVTPAGTGACASEAHIVGEVSGPEIEYTGSWGCGFAVRSAQIVVTLYYSSGGPSRQYDAVALSCNSCQGEAITPDQFVFAEDPACYQAITDVSGVDSFGKPFNLASAYSSLKCYKS